VVSISPEIRKPIKRRRVKKPLATIEKQRIDAELQQNLNPLLEETTILRWNSSDLELNSIWQRLVSQYFPDRDDLEEYSISWSERTQKRVLGSCNLTKRKVLIARALDRKELSWILEPLIYHELCHAVVGVGRSKNGRRNSYHGDAFYKIEKLHPQINDLDTWIKSGGWQKAVRSFSSHRGFLKRTQTK